MLVDWWQYLVIQRSMPKHVRPLRSPPPPLLPRVFRFSRVPGISLFWSCGSFAGSCYLGFGGPSDVGYGSDCLCSGVSRSGSSSWCESFGLFVV
eukprot:4618805-Pyramimonas_sp.AAC.1